MAEKEDVYCTLCMTDNYLPGAAVLAKSLRDTGTTKKLAVLIDQERLRPSTVAELQSLYNYTIPIERIGTPQPAALYLMHRPDLLYTFTKITLFRLSQFRRILYLDADIVALRAPDELFALPNDVTFAAAPDVGWPDAFNTGVMLIKPHQGDYHALKTLASAGDSFDGADQGLLNQYFEHKPWKRLSFKYNCTPSANYQYEPAYRYYKSNISLVHFIGAEKPWQQQRRVQGAPGAYQELLGRWWAVWDRHLAVGVQEYINGQKGGREAEAKFSSTGYAVDSAQPSPETTTEMPFTEPGEEAENIDQGLQEPPQTRDVRRFSAPYMEWDATRGAPPTKSTPEAANFPTTTYEFSMDPKPFVAPAAYPEPPRDLWYDVPKSKPAEEKLAPLFPWEHRDVPKPSRRFADEEKPPPPVQDPEDDDFYDDELAVRSSPPDPITPTTPTIVGNDTQSPWSTFGHHSTKNAWDEISGIDEYVRALTASQKRRANLQIIHHGPESQTGVTSPTAQQQQEQRHATAGQQHVLSPTNEPSADDLIAAVAKRRESLILTDFPTASERPSLPVTPAPIRRAAFWGRERDEEELPPAEGVPDQRDWDPNAQLEVLRRNSLLELKLPTEERKLSVRKMPAHSIKTQIAEKDEGEVMVLPVSGGSSPHGLGELAGVGATRKKPMFVEPDFAGSGQSEAQEESFAPTDAAI